MQNFDPKLDPVKRSSTQSDDTSNEHNQQSNYDADKLCKDVQASIKNAIDVSNGMPTEEYPLYSSYDFYNKVMQDSRNTINAMMNRLAVCSIGDAPHNSLTTQTTSNLHYLQRANNFNETVSLQDRYDKIGEFNEVMLDKVATNLDDAEGLRQKNAQLVEATIGKNIGNSSSRQNYNLYRSNVSPSSNARFHTSNHSNIDNANIKQDCNKHASVSNATSSNDINNSVSSCNLDNISNYTSNSGKSRQPYNAKAMQHTINQQTQQSVSPHQHNYASKQSLYHRHVILENKNIQRPQALFKDKIDNSTRPFEPPIKIKPNALVPLSCLSEIDESGTESFSHPYEYEIENFEIKPELLLPCEPQVPPSLEETPLTLVEDLDQLKEMCQHIEALPEIAVDVEHHSYRSFQGISCLIQISSRTRDFVIDAIKLRSELHLLNECFTNPNIVKVFHGADCDIIWLQRDFGVYVVNLFDTCRAAKLMKFAHLSLAFLTKHYCGVEADKYYQLADWRERPLPLPMINYARTDTHYLLYIYDRLRNDLLSKGAQTKTQPHLLTAVYERGREICLKKYEKPSFSETSHLSVLKKCRSTFNAKQMYAFKELFAWRDSISRELDESLGYVLPNNLMIRIAEYLPREPQGILALCNPIPPMVKRFVNDIHQLILKAREVPLDEVKVITEGVEYTPETSLKSLDLDAIGHRHDTAHSAGIYDNSVPPLLGAMFQSVSMNYCSDEFTPNSNTGQSNAACQIEHCHNLEQNPESTLYNFFGPSYRDQESRRLSRGSGHYNGSWRGGSHSQTPSDSNRGRGYQRRGNSRPANNQRSERSGNQAHNDSRKFESLQSHFSSPFSRYVSTSQQQKQSN